VKEEDKSSSWVQVVAAGRTWRTGGRAWLRAQCRRTFLRLAAFLCASSTGPSAAPPEFVYHIPLAAWSETRGSTFTARVWSEPRRLARFGAPPSLLRLRVCCEDMAPILLRMRHALGRWSRLTAGRAYKATSDHITPIVCEHGRSHSTDGEEGGGRAGRR
jgi:hypothetical protein